MNTYIGFYEWDIDKERINIQKHGIDFDTAALVFGDPFRLEKRDVEHSDYEDRYLTIGVVNNTVMMITVVYTERRDVIRIISARKATRTEREEYQNDRNKAN